jgi:hypothetical protein
MSNIFRVARKELASFFSSLAAFIFIGVFLAVCRCSNGCRCC